MFKKRNWAECWLLSMVTGGLYTAYMIFMQLLDIKNMDDDTEENYTMHLILFCLLFVCTFSLAGLIAFWIYQKKAVELGKRYNIDIKPHSGLIFSLLMYVPIYSYWLDVNNHNKLIEAYENFVNTSADEYENASSDYEQYVTVEEN